MSPWSELTAGDKTQVIVGVALSSVAASALTLWVVLGEVYRTDPALALAAAVAFFLLLRFGGPFVWDVRKWLFGRGRT